MNAPAYRRYLRSCASKVRFADQRKAQAKADKHGLRVYECPAEVARDALVKVVAPGADGLDIRPPVSHECVARTTEGGDNG